jgi:MATE family, multidrug efflux pump
MARQAHTADIYRLRVPQTVKHTVHRKIMQRWSNPNGYRQVLAVSLPLVASMGSITLMQFTDRVFLANYSVDAIAAALPAGIASFTFVSFFMGVANYTNTFVAQYTGAATFQRVGASLWQGIYFALISAALLGWLCFFSHRLFEFIGHSPQIRDLEVIYFNILILGAGLVLLGSTLACFYTGRGLTRVVMMVHLTGAVINIPLDYCLINGIGPFPELGIAGAAIATVTAYAFIVCVLAFLVFSSANRSEFGTWVNRSFDRELFGRLMRYGLPSGIQFFLEIFGFSFFIQMVGRLGYIELAASNIVFSIESLSFMPMVGFHVGTAIMVGQAIGRNRPEDGVYATSSALHITLAYMVILTSLFVFAPKPLLILFKAESVLPAEFARITEKAVILLRFVAVFCFFDAMNLTYSGAIKGAGDTRFIMWTVAALLVCVMVVPVYVAVEIMKAGLFWVWVLVTLYICSLGLAFMFRYRQGKWKKMRVIEARLK